MSGYTIKPTDESFTSAAIIATDPGQVLQIVRQLGTGEADVLEDGAYSYTLRLDDSGTWYIFRRESQREHETAAL